MKAVIAGVIGLTAIALAAEAGAAECRDDAQVIGQCFTVHGRLRVSAGLVVELWPVGTKRLLYVPYAHDGSWNRYLPANVRERLTTDNEVFGDFEVCPFERDRPGVMRSACIESATHLAVRPPSPDNR